MSIKYRSAHEKSGRDKFYEVFAPIITGVGAAVVIIGAWMKILHLPGGAMVISVGLLTEAVLFLLFAFAPPPTEPDWTIVHPELGDDAAPAEHKPKKDKVHTPKFEELLATGGITQEVVSKVGESFKSLTESVQGLTTVSNATVATNEYAENVKSASKSLVEMNKAYGSTVDAMSSMANASQDAKEYHSQVQNITKNLGALNAVYEMELVDANNHIKAMNKFYGNLSSAMESMAEASKETHQFKTELSKLTGNLSTLNTVYGAMLTAMKG